MPEAAVKPNVLVRKGNTDRNGSCNFCPSEDVKSDRVFILTSVKQQTEVTVCPNCMKEILKNAKKL